MSNNYFVHAWMEPAPGVRRQEDITLQEATNFGLDNNRDLLRGAGAVNLDVNHVGLDLLETTAANTAITLGVPKRTGQILVIECVAKHVSSSGSYKMLLTNAAGGTASTSATFDAVGEILVLVSAATKWVVLKQVGVTVA